MRERQRVRDTPGRAARGPYRPERCAAPAHRQVCTRRARSAPPPTQPGQADTIGSHDRAARHAKRAHRNRPSRATHRSHRRPRPAHHSSRPRGAAARRGRRRTPRLRDRIPLHPSPRILHRGPPQRTGIPRAAHSPTALQTQHLTASRYRPGGHAHRRRAGPPTPRGCPPAPRRSAPAEHRSTGAVQRRPTRSPSPCPRRQRRRFPAAPRAATAAAEGGAPRTRQDAPHDPATTTPATAYQRSTHR